MWNMSASLMVSLERKAVVFVFDVPARRKQPEARGRSRGLRRGLAPVVSTVVACVFAGTVTPPAGAAEVTTTGGVCRVTGDVALDRLGALPGILGQFLTNLRPAVRDAAPQAAADFDRADELLDQLRDASPGQRDSITAELISVYSRIDSTMVTAGFKRGEWRLAFPQALGNGRAYDPAPVWSGGQAAAIAADPASYQSKITDLAVAGKLESMRHEWDDFVSQASPALRDAVESTGPHVGDAIDAAAASDWSAQGGELVDAARECAAALGDPVATQSARNAPVPRVYVPQLADLKGRSGPHDTGIFEPIAQVNLFRGDSSEAGPSALIAAVTVLVTLALTHGPELAAALPALLRIPAPGTPGTPGTTALPPMPQPGG